MVPRDTLREYDSIQRIDAGNGDNQLKTRSREFFVLIDDRTLERECLALGMEARNSNVGLLTFSSVEDWISVAQDVDAAAILYNTVAMDTGSEQVIFDLKRIVAANTDIPVVVLGTVLCAEKLGALFDAGAKGYIPASVGVDAILQAARLAATQSGVFLPRSSVSTMMGSDRSPESTSFDEFGLTRRQMEVAKALRSGKANKVIAYDLAMKESTVKVHVRMIMKKLSATNRTEAAIILNRHVGKDSLPI